MSSSEKDLPGNIPSFNPVKIVRGLTMLILVILFGTIGYMILEGWQVMDSLYMTVITITTVGYREVNAISLSGKIFTIILIFLGMGIMAYTVGIVAQGMIEIHVRSILGRRRLGIKIKSIKNHYIICGYGRIGMVIANELKVNRIPFLVIDNSPERKQELYNAGVPYIIDDASREEVLIEAGIQRAKGLVAAVSSDADNVFITMSARSLQPNLFILARCDNDQTNKKLLRAGADKVARPYLIGGQKMAQTIIKPAVTDFLELTVHDKNIELDMEELLVGKESNLKGLSLVDSGIRQLTNAIIVAIRKKDGGMSFNPSSQTHIEEGDILIALGMANDLKKLETLLSDK